jgi:hypothetical protein
MFLIRARPRRDAYGFVLRIGGHSERHNNQIKEVQADPNFPRTDAAKKHGIATPRRSRMPYSWLGSLVSRQAIERPARY